MAEMTRPILGHLTESWAPPASCLSVQVGAANVSPWGLGYQGKTCNPGEGSTLSDDADCWPPRTANAPDPPAGTYKVFNGWGFYSPATLCPSGFTTACTATFARPVSAWSPQFHLTTGETAAGCCPSGLYGEEYSCTNWRADAYASVTYISVQTCALVANPTAIEVVACAISTDGVASQILASQVLPATTTISLELATSTATLASFELQAPLIQINWRAEDLATPTTTPTSSSSPSGTSSISSGVIAGIVIGAVVCLAGMATGMFWCIRKRRTRSNDNTSKTHQFAPSQQQSHPVESQPHTSQPLELLTTEPRTELPARQVAFGAPRVELQG